MAGGGADPFEGVSATELRRRLITAGDRRLDSLSVEAAAEARHEQAVLAAERDASSPGLSTSGPGTPS